MRADPGSATCCAPRHLLSTLKARLHVGTEATFREDDVRALADAEAAPRLDSTTECITVWPPRVNVEIDASVFEFTPPTG